MTEGLFRKEALDAQRGEELGSIQLQAPRFGWIFFCIGGLAVVALFAILIFGRYSRHERADGALVPTGGLLNVAPLAPGSVVRTLVTEGEQVHAGQALAEISGDQDSAALGDTHAAVSAQLRIKRTQLQSELQEARQLATVQQQEMSTRTGMLRAQIEQLNDQMALQKQRVQSSNALYEQWTTLRANGMVTKLQVLQQQDAALQNEMQLKEMNNQLLAIKQQLSQLVGAQKEAPVVLQTKLNELGRQSADIEQAISENEAQRVIVLRAQTDGTVVNLLVHAGQPVGVQQTVMTLLPAHAELQAVLWIPSRAVGFVARGDRVVLHYQAYPYQRFGEHYGRVEQVSQNAVSPIELSKLLGRDMKEASYRVLVNLDQQNVQAYGKPEVLRPGMALDADILLDSRRLIEWLAEPLRGMMPSRHDDSGATGAR
jgi:membrane fusion protein